MAPTEPEEGTPLHGDSDRIGMLTAADWEAELVGPSERVTARLTGLLNGDSDRVAERAGAYVRLVRAYAERWGGDVPVFIARAPGRLVTMARHADHRGSYCNPISLDREIAACVSPAGDDSVVFEDLNPDFGLREFRIGEEMPPADVTGTGGWLEWTGDLAKRRASDGSARDWVNKVKGVPVYMSHMVLRRRELRGYRGVFEGSIPPRAGLSSSSALVVLTLDVIDEVNSLGIPMEAVPAHTGAAEWYVGTRGGCGDQAAIKFGRPGMITHIRVTPELVLGGYMPFPAGYDLVIFHSGHEADKTGPAGNKFNEKTATYEIADMFIRRWMEGRCPEDLARLAESRSHLGADVKILHQADVVEMLPGREAFELLESIPERATRDGLRREFPGRTADLEAQFSTHREPVGGYPVRAAATFGLSECARGRAMKGVLDAGEIERYARMMNVSHDGDRASNVSGEARRRKFELDPDVPLAEHSGDYDCSTPEIDRMVDIALEAGAVGAQLSGAGLGGCMMALVPTERIKAVSEAVVYKYYEAEGLEPNWLVARPVAGACVI